MSPSEIAEKLCKDLADRGLIVEAGWKGYELTCMHPAAPAIQRAECRMAFFAGAQHLFGSIMTILDPEAEPTDNDLKRMSAIAAELERYIQEFKLKHATTKGSA